MMMMIAFISFNSILVPLIDGLSPWEFEFSGRHHTDDLGSDSPSLWQTEPRLHVRSVNQISWETNRTTPIQFQNTL